MLLLIHPSIPQFYDWTKCRGMFNLLLNEREAEVKDSETWFFDFAV
jgi:hypothetical protein